MINIREKALLALYEIEYNEAYSNLQVKAALSGKIEERDKALFTGLVYGCVRYKLTLDYIISKYSSVKLKKLSKYVRLILRLGIYQLYFLDRIPESAAVNESVKLANRYAPRSRGFINGVLRSAAKGKGTLEYPKDRIEYLSVKYSYPETIVKEFSELEFCEELLAALNKEPKTTVRINSLKTEALSENIFTPSPLYKYGAYIKRTDITETREYKEGEIIAQDIAAMMASVALAPKENQLVIDMCAAPGGKTTHLAQLMNNKGKIIAFDIHPHKTEIIKKNAERMGISIIETKCTDAQNPISELFGKADKVLLDAPCSGLGIISKKPDIKWNKENIQELPEIQEKLLKTASEYLKVGGELVYSTCTLLKRENEAVIEKFVEENDSFEFVKIEIPKPLMRDNKGYITFYPNIDGTDGFFISKIKRCK